MKKRVLIIGGTEKILNAARELELEIIYFQKKELFDKKYLQYAQHIFLTEYENLAMVESCARAIHKELPLNEVISLTEDGLIPSAHINEALKISGNSVRTVYLLKDKFAMRQHLNNLGLSTVASTLVRSEADILTFLAEHDCPAIIKPQDGAGSFGIFLIRSQGDVPTVWQKAQETG